MQAAFGHYSKDLNVFKMLETAYLFHGTVMDYDSTRRTPPESFDPKNLNYSSVSYTSAMFLYIFVFHMIVHCCDMIYYLLIAHICCDILQLRN